MYTLIGKVTRGTGYGKKLGFATANLDRRQYARLSRKPTIGIYAGTAKRQGMTRIYKAAIVVGPLDNLGLPKIEAHLLGFTGVLYKEKITLSLRKYLRKFMSFRNENVLKKWILKDIERVEKIIDLT